MKRIVNLVISKWLSLSKSQRQRYFYDTGTIGFCEEVLSSQDMTYLSHCDEKFEQLLDVLQAIYDLA